MSINFKDNTKMNKETKVQETEAQCAIQNVNPRFKINGLVRRKEGWRYAGSIERAKDIQKEAVDFGINSLIYEWIDNEWVNVG